MRKRALFVLAVVLASAGARIPGAEAFACDPSSIAAKFKTADAVFTGMAALVDRAGTDAKISFAVRDVFKGDVSEVYLVTTPATVEDGGLDVIAGKRYEVFTSLGSDRRPTSDVCSGTTDRLGTLARAGYDKPIRHYNETQAAGQLMAPKTSERDNGARAGAIGAAALLLALAGAFYGHRARVRRRSGMQARPRG